MTTAMARAHTTGRWQGRHLLGLQGLGGDDLRDLLARASAMRSRLGDAAGPEGGPLAGRRVACVFLEDSTRTRLSFQTAAQKLGGSCVDLVEQGSSTSKGEGLVETCQTVEAMGPAAIVVRASQSGAAALVAQHVRCPVINAGDGRHEHPTQGLLDTLTLAEAHGRLDGFDLSGLRVAIVGDIASSRVARSAIAALTTLGASVVCVGPPALAPASLATLGAKEGACTVSREFSSVLPEVDAVMMLRIQFERHQPERSSDKADAKSAGSAAIASVRDYRAGYALTAERAARMKPGAIVMHPGPMNPGLEIDLAAALCERSAIARQVELGVAVRMAVLDALCGDRSMPAGKEMA